MMVNKLLGNKKILFWAIFILVILICMATLGTTFAWMYGVSSINTHSQAGSLNIANAMSVDGVVNFELDPNIVGIVGETVEVTSINEILTESYTDPYIYRVTYSVKGSTAGNIEKIKLSDEKISQLGLIEYGSQQTKSKVSAVYYGVNSSVENLDMGALQVVFKQATNESADSDLYINVEVVSCQKTKEAFIDAYKISEKDMPKFNSLLGQ